MDADHPTVVLVADDAPEIRSMLSIRLGALGFQVLEAVDGHQTMDMVRQHYPDLVILDVMMPGKNGWEVAKEIRHDARFKSMGIIMLTAIGVKINEMTSPLYGADEYLDKPFEFSELEQRINKVLGKAGED
jgi:DNA-binding response OmpR family regulator